MNYILSNAFRHNTDVWIGFRVWLGFRVRLGFRVKLGRWFSIGFDKLRERYLG